jgi:hypothetical protein
MPRVFAYVRVSIGGQTTENQLREIGGRVQDREAPRGLRNRVGQLGDRTAPGLH